MDDHAEIDKLSLVKSSLDSFYDLNYFPAAFVLNLTHRCNFACNMCIQYGEGFKEKNCSELPLDQWLRFIESVAWFKPRITLMGGEPLLYPEIKEIVKSLARNNLQTELVTNGYYLQDYLSDMYDSNIDLILSIDGTSDIHNGIRNSEDSFERILRSLNFIKNKGGSILEKLLINYVLLPDNVDNLIDFLKFIDNYHPRLIVLQHPMFSSRELISINNTIWKKHFNTDNTANLFTKKKYVYDNDYIGRLTQLLTAVQNIKNTFQTEIYFSPGLSTEEFIYYYLEPTHPRLHPKRMCSRPWRRLSIRPNGDVLACLDYSVGNIAQTSFIDIWNGERLKKFRQVLLDIERFPICTRCCDFYNDRDYLHLPIDSVESLKEIS
jgi:MoaA/NifB/PqqE/SkfB family radical SAM enzyme